MIDYGHYDGHELHIYTITDGPVTVGITELGAAINFIRVSGTDIALGFNSAEDYLAGGIYAGATIGRVGNRICGGRFTLNGREHRITRNEGNNHLHGGARGFDKRIFTVLSHTKNSIALGYVSPDGEEGYPGTLKIAVAYILDGGNLRIDYTASSDKDTLWNPTNHTYFNLDGDGSGDCRDTLLQLFAQNYTPAGGDLIPTGEVRSVFGTPFDFTLPKAIGRDFGSPELVQTNGYDHNFIADGALMARAAGAKTGITLAVSSDMPCFQLYSGGGIKACRGRHGVYDRWSGFCVEPQFCPDAINLNGFAQPILGGGQSLSHYIEFSFGHTKA